jgi:diguanylate cyclase (GGDEF)-like protein/PAS domain S-box-containing protein
MSVDDSLQPTTPTRARIAALGQALLLGLAVAGLSALSLWLTRMESGVAAVWLANGLATAVLLSRRYSQWRGLLLAILAGLLLPRVVLEGMQGLALSAVNLLEVFCIAALTRRFGGELLEPSQRLQAARVAGLATLAATAASASLALVILLLQDAQGDAALSRWLSWFGAHLLGMVLAGSLALAVIGMKSGAIGQPGRRRQFMQLWLLLVAVLLCVMLQNRYPLLFLPLLPLMLLTFRTGMAGAVVGVLTLAVASSIAAAVGSGPFHLIYADTLLARSLVLQVYVLSAWLLALPLALLLAERSRMARLVERSESRYRLLAEHSRDLVVRLGSDGRRRYVSRSSEALLGFSPEQLVQARWDLVHPDDSVMLARRLAALFTDGGTARVQFRVQHREGHWVWIEALAERVPAEDGVGFDVVYSGRDVSERVKAEQALEALARTDALTGLPNRRQFEDRLQRALARSSRYRMPLALFALDLDHFKQINDSLGHAAGDQALRAFAERIRSSVYEVDVVARMGGDEFMVLMEHIDAAAIALQAAHKLLAAMQQPMVLGGETRQVGTSIGIVFCASPQDADSLIAAADAALYRAKAKGRGTVELVQQ